MLHIPEDKGNMHSYMDSQAYLEEEEAANTSPGPPNLFWEKGSNLRGF